MIENMDESALSGMETNDVRPSAGD
jgi:hypothetical protein